MNLEFYRNFTAIIEEGSMSAAAEKLHIAQSALSAQLKVLEKEFGTELMVRSGRNLRPTEAGKILFMRAKDICHQEEAAQHQIQACITGTHGILKLGVTHIFPDPTISRLLGEFGRAYPHVRFEVHEHKSETLSKMLNNNEIDIALMSGSYSLASNMCCSYAMTAPSMAVYSDDNPWLSPSLTEVPISMLAGIPLAYPKGIENRLISACRRAGFTPETFAICTTRSSVLLWAQFKLAVSVFVCTVPASYHYDDLCYRPITGDDFNVQRMLVTMADRKISPLANTFVEFASAHLHDWTTSTETEAGAIQPRAER